MPQVVKDSIRRDREALFGATRQVSAVTNSHHPSSSAHVHLLSSPLRSLNTQTRNAQRLYAQRLTPF